MAPVREFVRHRLRLLIPLPPFRCGRFGRVGNYGPCEPRRHIRSRDPVLPILAMTALSPGSSHLSAVVGF